MTKIERIWSELENDDSFSHGLLLRRYSGEVLPDIFVAKKSPEGYRCIAASLTNTIKPNIFSFSNLKDISVEIIPDDQKPDKNYLLFKLLNEEFRDIFSVLCEDLILNVVQLRNEDKFVKELLNRFEKWKSFFDKAASQGLTPEEERGLFGELYFLRKFLLYNNNFHHILDSWVGPSGEVRDFQMNSWALEVKTTHGNNHQKVQISSERQLDITHLDKLYLYHISLESVKKNGESLNQIITSIIDILGTDVAATNRFKAKLYEAGYFEHHSGLYSSTGYFIRQNTYYNVENNFPRIQENEIRSGVGDVKYSIILSQCQNFEQPEISVFENLTL